MKDLIELIQKKIQKNKNQGREWEYIIDLRNSCVSSDQYVLLSAAILGEGNLQDLLKIKINYCVHNSQKVYCRVKKIRGIEGAIKYIWDFPDNFNLCMNCCALIKKDRQCEQCCFYKAYMEYKCKKEVCGICQEESYRTILSCQHHFHRSCLLKMDPDDLKCPLCRHPVKEDIICNLFDEDVDDSDDEIPSDDEE
jgi:hypothetical protein